MQIIEKSRPAWCCSIGLANNDLQSVSRKSKSSRPNRCILLVDNARSNGWPK